MKQLTPLSSRRLQQPGDLRRRLLLLTKCLVPSLALAPIPSPPPEANTRLICSLFLAGFAKTETRSALGWSLEESDALLASPYKVNYF
jgi:hypothetical protein